MRTLITTIFTLTFFSNLSTAQNNTFRYYFKVDTLVEVSEKSFLSDFTNQLNNIQKRLVKGKYSFEIVSSEDLTEEYFSNITSSLNSTLVGFNKTIITYEYNFAEKNGGQDCPDAAIVCNNTSFSGNSSGAGTQELNGGNDGCLSGENQSSWYYVNIGSDGTLEMEIDPDANDDYDWAIWGPFDETTANANCPPSSQPIRCSWAGTDDPTGMGDYWGEYQVSSSGCGFLGWFACYAWGWITPSENSEGSGGDGWVAPINVQEDEIYILVVDNWSVSGDPFELNWGGSAGLDCTEVPLPVELISFDVEKNNIHNNIYWTTASETNNDYFILEYSPDGQKWKEIEKMDGAGNSISENTYYVNHRDFENGINYYRLKQVDFNGTINMHNIISIDNTHNRILLKRLNSMGQEVNETYKGIVFEYYNDGTIQKVIN